MPLALRRPDGIHLESRARVRHNTHLTILAVLAVCGVQMARCEDAAECPCIAAGSPKAIAIRGILNATGYPPAYGLEGCKAYDLGLALAGCSSNEWEWCKSNWCYVDRDLCPVDMKNCTEAGGLVGSIGINACRTRTSQTAARHPTTHLKTEPAWSYTTCGYADPFTMRIEEPIAGKNLIVAFDDYPTYIQKPQVPITVVPRKRDLQGWRGPTVDFFNYITHYYSPRPNLTIVSLNGMSKYDMFTNSDYDACVNKAAIGEVDVCISTFWITQPRQNVSYFTPPLYHDKFFLVVVRKPLDWVISSLILAPFAPFQPSVWGFIVVVVVAFAVIMVLVDYESSEDFPYHGPAYAVFPLKMLQSFFLSITGFLAAPAAYACTSMGAKIASLGFSIFCLIVVATYTANLAALLINAQERYLINSIDDFERLGLKLCMDTGVRAIFLQMFPGAPIHVSESTSHVPRDVHSGKCDGGLMYEESIRRMYAGYTVERDCGRVLANPAKYSAIDYACPDPENPFLVRDCILEKVGEMVLSIPVAFPVRPDLSHSLSWAVARGLDDGLWEVAKFENVQLVRQKKCLAVDEELLGMPPKSLYGTLIISFSFTILALIAMAVRALCLRFGEDLFEKYVAHMPSWSEEGVPQWASDLQASADAVHKSLMVAQLQSDTVGRCRTSAFALSPRAAKKAV